MNNMEVTLQMLLIVCPMVFLAGFIDAAAGGGGLISLPAYFLAGLPAHTAIATNKLSSSLGTVAAALRFYRNRLMQKDVVILGIVCALSGSAIGSNLSLMASENLIQLIMIPLLPFVAYYVLRGKGLKEHAGEHEVSRRRVLTVTALSAFVVGIYDGFYGPGTGTFLILLFTSLAHMDVRMASGNAKMLNLASNVMSLTVFLLNGKVLFALGIPAALCSIAGNYLGSGVVLKNGLRAVRPIIIIVLAILFVRLISELL